MPMQAIYAFGSLERGMRGGRGEGGGETGKKE